MIRVLIACTCFLTAAWLLPTRDLRTILACVFIAGGGSLLGRAR